ncbi:PAS domain S-box protein [Sagittula sp.]|uniref:PAS domain S-box protein n=1 Tax=Sagittula sp. TaxID=2038081 RepID=UPI0035111E74
MTQESSSPMESPESLQQHLAAIVENTADAIVTKNLDSIILTWNGGAERLFGYSADEAVGQPITMLIPADRQDEEVEFITKLRRGERISNFETVRRRKDGSFVNVSLTVSPVRDVDGHVIGASKIARDITAQREAEERQQLLLSEMRHRVGNSFAVAGGLLAIAARQAGSMEELVQVMRGRLNALSSVHSMAVSDPAGASGQSTTLSDLISSILAPFADETSLQADLPDIQVCSSAITPLALVVFELATNAVKYGGLSDRGRGIAVNAVERGGRLVITWRESAVTTPGSDDLGREGFGTSMCQSTVRSSLGGTFCRDFNPDGMTATLDLDLASVTGVVELNGSDTIPHEIKGLSGTSGDGIEIPNE